MKRIHIILIMLAVGFSAMAQRIAVLSDIHVTPGSEREAKLRAAVEEINSTDVDIVIVDGDLTNEGSDIELRNVKGILDGITHPLYLVPGNHENNWSQSATRTFTDLWGDDRFVVTLDSLLIVGINCGPYMKMGDGHIKQEDLHWLRQTLDSRLRPGMRVLSINHYPIRKDDIDNYQDYADLLLQYPVIAHINGHYHHWEQYAIGDRLGGVASSPRQSRPIGDIPGVMVRALLMGKGDETNFGYALLTITDDRLLVEEKKLGQAPSERFCIDLHDGLASKPSKIFENSREFSKIFDVEDTSREAVTAGFLSPRLVWADSASVFTRLAFDNNNVYFGTSTGIARAVDKATGREVWRYAVPSGAPIFSRVTVLPEGRVAVPHATGIAILSAETGALIGDIPSREGPYVADGLLIGDTTGRGRPFPQSVDAPARYIQGGYKRIESRDALTGALQWSYDSIYNYCQGAPVADGDDLVFGAWDTYLRCLDLNTGSLRWSWSNGTRNNQTGPGNVVPVVTPDRVIIVAPDRYMTALDRQTGRQLWRDNSYRYRESLGHSEDMTRAYAKTMDGELVAVDTQSPDWRIVWVCDMGIGYDHAPCVVAERDGIVYAGSRRGIVTAVRAGDGALLWQLQAGSSEINGIDIDPTDGTVWLSLIEGHILRISPPTP